MKLIVAPLCTRDTCDRFQLPLTYVEELSLNRPGFTCHGKYEVNGNRKRRECRKQQGLSFILYPGLSR